MGKDDWKILGLAKPPSDDEDEEDDDDLGQNKDLLKDEDTGEAGGIQSSNIKDEADITGQPDASGQSRPENSDQGKDVNE